MVSSTTDPVASFTKITELVADPIFLQDFKEWIGMFSYDEWEENASSVLSSFLDSYNVFSREDKFNFLKKLLKELEKEYGCLLAQRNSQDFSYQNDTFEVLNHQQNIVSSLTINEPDPDFNTQFHVPFSGNAEKFQVPLEISKNQLPEFFVQGDDNHESISISSCSRVCYNPPAYDECKENHQQGNEAYIFYKSILPGDFYDPVALYMEIFVISDFVLLLHHEYQFQLYFESQFLISLFILIFQDRSGVQSLNQLFDWLHWKYHIT
jgi:hypothetical protein